MAPKLPSESKPKIPALWRARVRTFRWPDQSVKYTNLSGEIAYVTGTEKEWRPGPFHLVMQ
jgi:hypothetical protein